MGSNYKVAIIVNPSRKLLLSWTSVLFISAIMAAYVIMLLPIIGIVVTSFFSNEIISFPPDSLTLRWYENAWARNEFVSGFLTSVQVALMSTAIGVPLGTAAAYALVRSRLRNKEILNTILLSPLIVPGIVAGPALYISFLRVENWFSQDVLGTLFSLVAAHVLLTIPWTVRLVTTSLQTMELATEEAAANLGASPLTVFRRITLPALRPGVVAGVIFSFIASLENLEMTLLLVGPGRSTLPIAMMSYLEFRIDPTIAAVATVQIVIIGTLMLISDRFVKLSQVV